MENESKLINLLIEGKITKVEYLKKNPEINDSYEDFCAKRGLYSEKDDTAEAFWEYQGKEEMRIY